MTRMQRLMIVVAGFGLVGSTGWGVTSITDYPLQCRDTDRYSLPEAKIWHDCSAYEFENLPDGKFSASTIEAQGAGTDYRSAIRNFFAGMLATLLVIVAIASFGWIKAGKAD